MKKVILGISVIFLCSLFPLPCLSADPAAVLLDEIASKTASTLKTIDLDISKAAKIIGEGISPATDMRRALRDLCAGKSYSVDCSFINAKGLMEIVEPEKYRKFEGTNLKDQAVVSRIRTTRRPVFSQLFTAAEGLQGIVFEYPVFSPKKEFAGSVSLFVVPELLMQEVLKNVKLGPGTGITVVQPDGTNVYASDPEQVRLNVLKSPEYKGFGELRQMVGHIVNEKEGKGTYRYTKPGTEKVVKKSAIWKTAPLYDSYWRIVITTETR